MGGGTNMVGVTEGGKIWHGEEKFLGGGLFITLLTRWSVT